MFVADGTATLLGTSVTNNTAKGGAGAGGVNGTSPGFGFGGGIYNENAIVYLDAFTVSHIKNNKASTNYPDIAGPYTLLP